MARFRLGTPALGGGDSMVDLYKTIVQTEQKEKEREVNTAKATISSLISSYNTAKSQPLQQEIINTMKSYYEALPQVLRAGVEPYMAHGPTSPMAEKRREWRKFRSPPKPVSYEIIEGVSNEQEWAEAKFESLDYKRAENGFLYGEKSAGERVTLFSAPFGNRVATRNKEGMVSIVDAKHLGIKQLAEQYGLDEDKALRAVYLDNGRYPSGNKVTVTSGGETSTYEMDYNLLAKPGEPAYSQRLTDSKRAPLPPETTFPKDLGKFVADLALRNTEDSDVEAVLDMIDDAKIKKVGERRIMVSPGLDRYFKTRWSDYTVEAEQFDKGSWLLRKAKYFPPLIIGLSFFTDWSEVGKPNYMFTVTKGIKRPLQVEEGKRPLIVYIDSQGIIRNRHNEILGYNAAEVKFNILERLRGD